MRIALASWLALVVIAGPLAAADLSGFTTADALWAHVEQLQQKPVDRPRTPAEAQAVVQRFLANLDEAAGAFASRYPSDPRRWDAKLIQLHVSIIRTVRAGEKLNLATLEPGLKGIVEAQDARLPARSAASFTLLQLHAEPLDSSSPAATVGKVDAEIVAFQQAFPQDPRQLMLQFLRAKLWERADPAKAESLLKGLATNDNAQVTAEAQQQLTLLALKRKPFDLTFTALDGRPFDLAKLRGKVVLIDFWATWCGPCREQIPALVAAYQKLHEKGFEIVGISLDKDKEQLTQTTATNQMTWPEYFDGKQFGNQISSKYGIEAIPTQWLVDKKGFLRYTESRDDLEAQVEKLLAE